MHAYELPPPSDTLTQEQQRSIAQHLASELEKELAKHGKSWRAGLFLLVPFVWGWARRCGWGTQRLMNHAGFSWETCSRLTNETQQPWQQAIVAGEKSNV